MDADRNAQTAQRLLATANLHRVRGNLDAALANCQQAVDLAPEDAGARDCLGDLLVAAGRLPEAMEQYRHAFQLSQRPAIEEKIARLALRIEDDKRLAALNISPSSPSGMKRRYNPSVAAGLSVLFPGLGQLYNGETTKGCVLVAIAAVLTPVTLPGLTRALLSPGGGSTLMWLLGMVLSGLWLYAMVDASMSASTRNREGDSGAKTGWEI